MIRGKQSSPFRSLETPKFLTRSNSEAQSFFACCSGFPTNEQQVRLIRKDSSNNKKISMKNVMKKSSILPSKSATNLNQNFSQSNIQKDWSPMTPKSHSRIPSDLSISKQSQLSGHSKLTKKRMNKVNFSYKMRETGQGTCFNSYNPTNYIVDKYIVQPQEMNIIFTNNNASLPPAKQMNPEAGRYFDLSEQFEEENHVGNHSPKFQSQAVDLKPKENPFKGVSPRPERNANNCHFSFGKGQKQQFLSKLYAGFREVESRRQSENEKQPANRAKPLDMNAVNERLTPKTIQQQTLIIPPNSLLGFVKTHVSAINSQDDDECEDSIVIVSSDKLQLLRPSSHYK